GSPLPGPTPTATPGSATIAGQVTDSQTRLPIIAATVSVSPGGQSVLTDTNGNFSLSVSPGTYTVMAKANGYSSASQAVTVNGGQKTNVVFRLVSVTVFGSLNGAVIDSLSKAPIAAATVTLSDGMLRVSGGLSKQVLDRALAFDEGGDHLRIEVRGRAFQDLGLRVFESAGRAVGSIGSHGVQGIGHRQDPSAKWDLIGMQLIGIAVAVPALVMVADQRQRSEERRVGKECSAWCWIV